MMDFNHVSDQAYIQYRKNADIHYQARADLARKSKAAYKQGDKAGAKSLSDQAKEEVNQAEYWNRRAAEYVFVENNRDSDENDIDLHGLYVREAEYILKQRIINGIYRKQASLDCIVGKGLHSQNRIAKLKPAVEQMCQEAGLRWEVDPKNQGIVMIYLDNPVIPQSWSDINPEGVGAMKGNAMVPDTRVGGHKASYYNVVYQKPQNYANNSAWNSGNAPVQQQQQSQQQFNAQQQSGFKTSSFIGELIALLRMCL